MQTNIIQQIPIQQINANKPESHTANNDNDDNGDQVQTMKI